MKHINLLLAAFLLSFPCFAYVAPITGGTSLCTGSSTTLTDATPGGIWTSSNPAVATVSATGVVTGISAGTLDITYTVGTEYEFIALVVNPLPAAYTVIGGGAYCSGGTGVHIGLSGSDIGIDYQLYESGTPVGAPVAGNGGTLDFGLHLSGSYTVRAADPLTGCFAWMTGTVAVAANPLPIAYTVTGGGTYCTGGHIMLSGSDVGVNYSLFFNGVNLGMFMAGTGAGIDFGIQTRAGLYTVTGTNATTGCRNNMANAETITLIDPVISGASAVCVGATQTLTSSAGGTWTSSGAVTVSSGGVVTGASTGTGNVTFTSTSMGCTAVRSMTVVATPGGITGPGSICPGSTGTFISSTPGGIWTTSVAVVAIVGSITGVVTPVTAGTTVLTYSLGTGCTVTKTVTASALPNVFTISGGGAICSGGAGSHILLSGSQTGVTYQLFSGATAVGAPMPGTGVMLDFGPYAMAGTYTAAGTSTDGCMRSMTGSATINLYSTPSITGPSFVCIGNTISLSTSVSGGVWTNSDPGIATLDPMTGGLTGIAIGSTNIQLTLTTGCSVIKPISVVPATCTGAPTAGPTTASTATICPGSSTTLDIPTATLDCGVGYQWQSSGDGTTYTDIAGETRVTYTAYPSGTQFYRCRVTCASSGLSSYSTPMPINVRATINSHSIASRPDTVCNNLDFFISACGASSSLNVTTWFGDGTSINSPLSSSTSGYDTHVYHGYNMPGTYNIKQVLYNGTIAQDSVSFSHEYMYCRTLPIKFYFDVNSNCSFDAGDKLMTLPIRAEIDSAGVPVDTISATSGLYYKAYGPAGTIYGFKVISAPGGLTVACPSTAILYDTIAATVNNYESKYLGFTCSGASSGTLDLRQYVSTQTGRHTQTGTITITNTFCAAQDADVTLHYNPRYQYYSSTPSAISYTDSTATWHLASISASGTGAASINYHLEVPYTLSRSGWLLPGDTVHSTYVTIAPSGDIDPNNNVCDKKDTVRSSFDPNDIAVSPSGFVLPCTKLQYTIRFENDGNDTAHNIYVLDTLSDKLDLNSLNIEVATSAMNVAIIKDGHYNIAKFDFPNIKLPDSSHHNQCNGMLIYTIKTKPGITDGSVIPNRAGIYFDDNPVVLTNTIQNVIGIAPIAGPNNVCITKTIGLDNGTEGGRWSSSNPTIASIGTASAIVSGIVAGVTNISYAVSNSCGSRYATSTVTVNPNPLPISGASTVCAGATTALTSTGGGTWSSSSPATAAIGATTGTVTGITADTAVITYTLPTGCNITKIITVTTAPAAITGGSTICAGTNLTLADATPSGRWYSSAPTIATIGSTTGIVSGVSGGIATITYSLSTSCIATSIITINAQPSVYSITGGGAYCAGDTGSHILLSSSDAGINYFVHRGSVAAGPFAGTGTMLDLGYYATAGTYKVSATNTATTCTRNMPDSTIVSITPTVLPAVSLITTPGSTLCEGTPVSLSPVTFNGGSLPIYQWIVNGLPVATGSTYSFYPANGDLVSVKLTSNADCARPDTARASTAMTVYSSGPLSVTIGAVPGVHVVVGETVTFTATVTGGSSTLTYQWQINGTPVPGATNATYTTNTLFDGDVIKCKVDDDAPCTTEGASSVTVSLNATGVKNLSRQSNISIYPNPNKGTFILKGLSEDEGSGPMVMQITDMLGREVMSKEIRVTHNIFNENIEIPANVSNGVYTLTLVNGPNKQIIRLIIEK